MITPTIGRVVLVRVHPDISDQPLAGLIAYVHSDTTISVAAFSPNGKPLVQPNLSRCHLKQSDDEQPPLPYAEWMPYQKGQAAKTEALEAKLRA